MLCRRSEIKKPLNKQNKDSLQANQTMLPPAIFDTSGDRASSCTSLGNGSFTVEAALVVPMFFLAVIVLSSMLDMVRVWSSVTLSLNESAKALGMYAYATEEMLADAPVQAVETGACIAYAQARLPDFKRVRVSLLGSSYRNHIVSLNAKITYQFPIRFALIKQATFYSNARVHAWTGYRAQEDGIAYGAEESMVYITERQTVYHTHSDCTHLSLSVLCMTRAKALTQRNLYGETYAACTKCKPAQTDTILYATRQGDKYHSDAQCHALKRTVQLVSMDAVSGLRECSRCKEQED